MSSQARRLPRTFVPPRPAPGNLAVLPLTLLCLLALAIAFLPTRRRNKRHRRPLRAAVRSGDGAFRLDYGHPADGCRRLD